MNPKDKIQFEIFDKSIVKSVVKNSTLSEQIKTNKNLIAERDN